MTVKFHLRRISLPSLSRTSFIPSSSPFTFVFLSSFFDASYKKFKKSQKIFLEIPFSGFDFQLPIHRTIKFDSRLDLKLDTRLYCKLPILCISNFESCFDYERGHFILKFRSVSVLVTGSQLDRESIPL